jgi:iron complex transport system ATP-binding protein
MRLDVRNITVRAGQAILVSDASFSVSPGEFVGLIGPNGAGKSTLLKSVVGIRPRDAGEVMLDGKPIADFSPRERARRLAFLPQERRVEWRVPARDVVMLGRYPHHSGFGGATDADREAVADAIARVDAASVEDRPAAVREDAGSARPRPCRPRTHPAGRRADCRPRSLPPAPRHGDIARRGEGGPRHPGCPA